MASVRVGQTAEIKLNAYPDKVLKGTISNIGSILDPNIRTAKVRIELANRRHDAAGHVRHSHFVRQGEADLHGCPTSAIVHLHDRDWVSSCAREV